MGQRASAMRAAAAVTRSSQATPLTCAVRPRFDDVVAEGHEAGSIDCARDWHMRGVTLITSAGAPVTLAHAEHVDQPRMVAER